MSDVFETRLLRPFTVGFDWELWVVDRGGLPVGRKEQAAIRAELNRREPSLPIGLDFDQVELRSGIARTFGEIEERAVRAYSALARVAARRKREVFPFAGHPLIRNFSGGHVHAGTVVGAEFALAVETRNAFVRYVPALVALTANSPFTDLRAGAFKSYRAAFRAYSCAFPPIVAAPGLAYGRGGEDVCLKIELKPTIEVRAGDSASSPRLFAEFAALAAGLVAGVAAAVERGEARRPDEAEFEEALANRFNAARHGLQATFRLAGREVSAGELVEEALAVAAGGLRALGTEPGALGLIRRMVDLRQTQADFLRWAAAGQGDFYGLPRLLLNAAGEDGRGFERYLASAPRLCRLAHEPLADAVRGRLGKARPSPWQKVNYELSLPPALLARIAGELAREGEAELSEDPAWGLALRETRKGGETSCNDFLAGSSRSGARRRRPVPAAPPGLGPAKKAAVSGTSGCA